MVVLPPRVVEAITRGDSAALIEAISSGVSIAGFTPKPAGGLGLQDTALTLAVRQNDLTAARILLDAGADPAIGDTHGNYPVTLAAYKGLEGFAPLFFIHGADLEVRTSGEANTALGWAARMRHHNTTLELLQLGARVDGLCHEGLSPLGHAALVGGNEAIIQTLLDYGADPNFAGENGVTPLHNAARNYDLTPEMVFLLLDAGADRGRMLHDQPRNTPAQVAASLPRPNQLFLDTLASRPIYHQKRSARAVGQQEPLREAICQAIDENDPEAVREIIGKYDIDVAPTTDANKSPLFHAVNRGNREALRLFSTLKLFADDRDYADNTAVHKWVERMDDRVPGDVTTLKHMVRAYGADAPNEEGHTVTTLAGLLGKFTAVAACLQAGASLSGLPIKDLPASHSQFRDLVNPLPRPNPHNTFTR